MAVARPPQYSSYNRRSSTMSKKRRPTLSFNTNPGVASRPRPRPSVKPLTPLRRPPTPGTGGIGAPPPAAPNLQQVPAIGAGGAPVGLQSSSDRIASREGYGLGMNEVNRRIMDAAMRYGGASSVQQFGYDPTSGADTSSALGVTTNPEDNSALSVIARNAALQGRNIDETAGSQNTFFSTRRLGDLQEVNSDADRQRVAAKQEYDSAIADYVNQLMGLRSSRDESFRNADISDIAAAAQNEPTNQIPQPASPPRPPRAPIHVPAAAKKPVPKKRKKK